jgi:hypothetical protein
MQRLPVQIAIWILIMVWPHLFESCVMDSSGDTCTAGVAITFDDVKYVDDWLSVTDTLTKKYDFRATFFIDHFDLLNDQQIEKLHVLQDLGSEIGYHGLRHRDAIAYCETNSIDSYVADEILSGLQIMQQKGFFPSSFAYPMGRRGKKIDRVLLGYFKILRGTYAHGITKPPASYYQCDYHATRVLNGVKIDCDSPYATSDIVEGLQHAQRYNCVLILYGHGITVTRLPMSVSRARIEEICSFVIHYNMKFYTLSELVKN